MGNWLQRLFGARSKVLTLEDHDFGHISFDEHPQGSGVGIWQMHDDWELPNASAKLGCNSIPGGREGPYPEARAFLLAKKSRAAELWGICEDVLQEIRDKRFPSRKGEPLRQVFVMTSLGLDEPITDPACWSVGFESQDPHWVYVEVALRGDEVTGHVCDT
jgi:hypothetical protein